MQTAEVDPLLTSIVQARCGAVMARSIGLFEIRHPPSAERSFASVALGSGQNAFEAVIRNASGSIGCRIWSITPFWHTAAGATCTGKQRLNRLSVLMSDP